jgi:hypothetical protein
MRTFVVWTFVAYTWDYIPAGGLMQTAPEFFRIVVVLLIGAGSVIAVIQDIKELFTNQQQHD